KQGLDAAAAIVCAGPLEISTTVRKELTRVAFTPFCQQLLLELRDKNPGVAAYTLADRVPRHGLPAVIRDVAHVRRIFFLDIPERHGSLVIQRQENSVKKFDWLCD